MWERGEEIGRFGLALRTGDLQRKEMEGLDGRKRRGNLERFGLNLRKRESDTGRKLGWKEDEKKQEEG